MKWGGLKNAISHVPGDEGMREKGSGGVGEETRFLAKRCIHTKNENSAQTTRNGKRKFEQIDPEFLYRYDPVVFVMFVGTESNGPT